jgi:hypothetical protein
LDRHPTSDNGHGNEKGDEYPQEQERGFGPRAYRDGGSPFQPTPRTTIAIRYELLESTQFVAPHILGIKLGPLEDEATMKMMVQA